jgi:hypothetical protein
MTTWNYRVIKKTCPNAQETTYQVHEIYYALDGSIECWNDTPVEPLGLSESSLRNDIHSFLAAFRLPVLVQHYTCGKAILVEEVVGKKKDEVEADYASKASRASSYLYQVLGNHSILKQEPALREAYERVDQALTDLHEIVDSRLFSTEKTAD